MVVAFPSATRKGEAVNALEAATITQWQSSYNAVSKELAESRESKSTLTTDSSSALELAAEVERLQGELVKG